MKLFKILKFRKSILLKEVANEWLLYKKASIKSSTYYRYKYVIDKYILPYFNNKSVYYFLNYDFNVYINYLSKNISPKTVKDIIIVFRSIMKYSERKFNIDYMLDLMSSPRCEQEEISILQERERMVLEKYCFEHNNLRTLGIIICLNTGMRIGEICALTWNDINLKDNVFIINKSLQRVYKGKSNTSIQINSPKSKKSIRKIPICKKLSDVLTLLKKTNKYKGDEYFLTGCNKYMEPRYYQYLFKKYLKECKIPNYNFHVLRHTFATNCVKIGMDVKSLSEILGHANVNMTLNRYVHSSYTVKKKFLEKL